MKRSKFSLSHYKLQTFDQGPLVPCALTEVLPGDTFQMSTSALIRVSPLLAPVMHPVQVRIHHWFVPNRLVWTGWESFITGGADGFDASVFPVINLASTDTAVGSLADYYGLPPQAELLPNHVSALPFRGYALIWNEFYRDQDLQPKIGFRNLDGGDTTTNKVLQNVCWEKDYFTSARPWTQKGPAVTIPLAGLAPIKGIGVPATVSATNATVTHFATDPTGDFSSGPAFPSAANIAVQADALGPASATNRPNAFADLTGVQATNINQLRLAFAVQSYEENRARYGSRYTEYLAFLGVRSSDARLQRPEYLGGGKQTIQFSEVLQTGPDPTSGDGVGDLKGHGISALRSNRFRKYFEEHGYIHSFISVKPRTMYSQGVARHWLRRVKEDFHQKEFEGIGQQEIYAGELYAAAADPKKIWGYQDRYDELRRQESGIAGEFRTTALDYWHMARQFATEPTLNAAFVSSNPTKRIYSEQTAHSLWVMINHRIAVRRGLRKLGTPKIF